MKYKEEIEKIKDKMRKLFPETPLEKNEFLSKKYGANIYLKREDLSPVRSYKIRGAFHLISSAIEEKENINFSCASAGNHAQGFAYACAYFKKQGTVFMPTTTPRQKVERTKNFGGKYIDIKLFGDTFDEALEEAVKFTKQNKSFFVPPFDHEKIIDAAATVSSEVLDTFSKNEKNLDLAIFPVGGGGLSSGNTKYLKKYSPKTKICYVEPMGAPSLFTSVKNEENTKLTKINTFVDGCAVAKIGDLTFNILKENTFLKDTAQNKKNIFLPSEDSVSKTILETLHNSGIVLEPAGALSITALEEIFSDKKRASELKNKNILAVISGGNFDFSRLPELEERKLKHDGVKKYIILKLPQRSGALKEFLNLLGEKDDISHFEYFKKSSANFGSVLIGIETDKKNNFQKLFQKMKKNNFDFDDVTDDEIFLNFIK